MKNKQITMEKRVGLQLYLSLFLYMAVGMGLALMLQFIFPKFDNDILAWLYWRIDLIFNL